ncbi:hypothetical protein [Bradyrhizobium elkanii]|nr:hypothetical protein [Bradyrhizobium elkanii]
MKRQDAIEAAGIVDRMLANLIATVPPKGRAGSQGPAPRSATPAPMP